MTVSLPLLRLILVWMWDICFGWLVRGTWHLGVVICAFECVCSICVNTMSSPIRRKYVHTKCSSSSSSLIKCCFLLELKCLHHLEIPPASFMHRLKTLNHTHELKVMIWSTDFRICKMPILSVSLKEKHEKWHINIIGWMIKGFRK